MERSLPSGQSVPVLDRGIVFGRNCDGQYGRRASCGILAG
jgi:hypothetical protein